jgi:pyruvate/2-oxoglutarate dehydrogenase complex dihydrolipoamide acyltransferase (E2) component
MTSWLFLPASPRAPSAKPAPPKAAPPKPASPATPVPKPQVPPPPAAESGAPAGPTGCFYSRHPGRPFGAAYARELVIDLSQVTGSGPGGRISVDDVRSYSSPVATWRPLRRQLMRPCPRV